MSNAQKHEQTFVRVIKARVSSGARRAKELVVSAAKLVWRALVGTTKVVAHSVAIPCIFAEEIVQKGAVLARVAVSSFTLAAQVFLGGCVLVLNAAISLLHKLVWGALLVLRTPSMLFYGNDVAKTDWGIWVDAWKPRNFSLVEPGSILSNEIKDSAEGLLASVTESDLEASINRHPGKGRPTPKQRKNRPPKLRMA